MKFGQAVSEEKIFEIGGQTTDRRTTEHGHPISTFEPSAQVRYKSISVMIILTSSQDSEELSLLIVQLDSTLK